MDWPCATGYRTSGNGFSRWPACTDLGGVPRIAERISGWFGRSCPRILGKGRSSPSEPDSGESGREDNALCTSDSDRNDFLVPCSLTEEKPNTGLTIFHARYPEIPQVEYSFRRGDCAGQQATPGAGCSACGVATQYRSGIWRLSAARRITRLR